MAITQGDELRGRRKGKARGPGSCVNSIMKYTPGVQKGPFIFLNLVEMEYIMRLYLGLDNMTALSNEIVREEIHYPPHYDLIKPHKFILIFPPQRFPSYLAFPLEPT